MGSDDLISRVGHFEALLFLRRGWVRGVQFILNTQPQRSSPRVAPRPKALLQDGFHFFTWGKSVPDVRDEWDP